jgi:hypothetical protein
MSIKTKEILGVGSNTHTKASKVDMEKLNHGVSRSSHPRIAMKKGQSQALHFEMLSERMEMRMNKSSERFIKKVPKQRISNTF